MAAELPVPYLEGVTIRDVGDGLIIRIDGAPDLDRALLKIERGKGFGGIPISRCGGPHQKARQKPWPR